LKLSLFYIGKARDTNANAMASEYIKRSSRFARCEMREVDPRRWDPFLQHPSAVKVFCDPAGRSLDTPGFVKLVDQSMKDGWDLLFLIGGHDGLPPDWKPRADLLISLSGLTMPHELARVILSEQIYRSLTTLRGHPYPR
jgi:23S rRNA (pseudouridine1915-N3)-methyltransferase